MDGYMHIYVYALYSRMYVYVYVYMCVCIYVSVYVYVVQHLGSTVVRVLLFGLTWSGCGGDERAGGSEAAAQGGDAEDSDANEPQGETNFDGNK